MQHGAEGGYVIPNGHDKGSLLAIIVGNMSDDPSTDGHTEGK
jgi:hypothetical protein